MPLECAHRTCLASQLSSTYAQKIPDMEPSKKSAQSKPRFLSIRDFHSVGMSMTDWAKENNFNPQLVRKVLRGERKCLRGESYAIAKELGMK